jgi:ubiquinone/menaquinone biosynthesis C-methylase UbiE
MKAYYHARAPEYDDWWLGRGLYADRERPGWDAAVEELADTLRKLPAAKTLDVACGTGFLTQHLAGEIVGLDQSPTMLELAQQRVPHAQFVVGDALELPFPDASFERVFASFFYCHLVEPEHDAFVAQARRVAPELVVVGSVGQSDGWEDRTLNDGSTWQVYKRLFDPDALAHELGGEIALRSRWFVVVRS